MTDRPTSPVTQCLIEQVAEGAEPEHLAPPTPSVLLAIVEHVTPLAERGEVAGPVVAWVVVQMRAGQDHAGDGETRGRAMPVRVGLSCLKHLRWWQPAHPPAAAITPGAALGIPPGAVAQVRDVLPMQAAAALAAALGASEADDMGQLAPVDGVIPAVLRSDRHDGSLSHRLPGSNPDVSLVCGAVLPERPCWDRFAWPLFVGENAASLPRVRLRGGSPHRSPLLAR